MASTMHASQADRDWRFRNIDTPDCPVCGANPCYLQCPNSPDYYSPEREREESLWEDSLSHDQWFSMAVRQYESIHGEGSYCS